MDAPIRQIEGDLSILNHPATRLKGPSLLHFLVQNSSQDGQAAIDFLNADDRRTFLSYAEFHHESDALASKISALAGPSEHAKPFVVPVLIPQSPELYIALLAIIKAGGAFCPMNLDVPLNRAKFILDDVAARVVITTSDLASRLPEANQSVLIIDRNDSNDLPGTIAHRQPTPADLAYVMYTSGSTGTPKGVGVSHDAVTQSLLAHDRHIPQFSRFLQFAAPTFDVSIFEIFFPFFRGKTLVSCTRQAMLNDLPGVIQKMDVDACELTPSVACSLLRTRENAPGLRLLLTIGEMLTQPVVDEFGGNEDRPSMLWGMYGPTEATIHCTLQPAFSRDSAVRNIGIPLDTVSAFILKIPEEASTNRDEFAVLPRGEVGELAIGGYQLAEGYLNRPEQTAAAFIDTLYGRLYRTGDKAKMLPDGTLECLGRIADGQVKLRGQRMELGEVEHAALKTPGCHSAVAAVTDAMLVLFCAVDGTGDMADAILESCRQWLPGFMLPGDVVVVQSFPRLASGKVDRKRLIAEYTTRTPGIPHKISYEDDIEEQLCNLTSRCLGVEVDPKQDLSKAGLDSLNAIKLASVLRGAGFEVGAIEVLEERTISAICKRIRSRVGSMAPESASKPTHSALDISDIVASHMGLSEHGQLIETIVPCTPLQTSMLAETMANSRAYCNWVELGVAGTHSEESIRSWFMQLAQMNEVLRTGFIHHSGQLLQVVFEQLPESSILITDSIIKDFELREDADFLCPFRVQCFSSPDRSETRVVLQIHHSVYDGWSLDLMLSDLAKLVQGEQLDPRPQFRQITAYHQSPRFTNGCDDAREFWAENLLGFQPPALPILTPKTDNAPAVVSSAISIEINPESLKTALQTIDCGPQTIFQAALAWIWSSMAGTEDVVVGSIQSGRTMPISRIEDIVGPCIASVPLRTNLSEVQTIKDLLVSVHAGNRATLPHCALPLAEIKRAAGIRSGQSLYDALFIYQESLHSKGQSIDTVRRVAHQDYLETKLLVEVEPRDKDFDCRFTYHLDVFPESQILVIGELIQALIPHMLENLNSELRSLRKASPRQLLSSFNQSPKTFRGVPDLATAVERVAATFPDKDAVCFADSISDGTITTTTITFAELDKTANRIAWHLSQQGVREGGIVAIVMEKSIRLYAGLLAILKTGCAYLPLLPNTPVARIETILQQAQVGVCVVDTATQGKLQTRLPCSFINLQSLDFRQTPSLSAKPQPNPDRLAYIIYTSGSTGVPKGVCLTQLNIMGNLDVLSRIYPVKDASRLLQSCSQAFDVSVFEIFFAWTQNMCLCSGTNDTLFEDLERSIRKLNVTHLSMTPTVASLVDPAKVPRVEFLVTAGEPMTEVVAQRWGDKLYQGYGPSETTNICSVKKMRPNQAIQHLGWSFENTSTFVLAQDGTELVPFGCLGEFCFGGDQIAQGYLNMEELTAAKFINHVTLGRLYRSGDLGRMLPDGSMVIAGRADEQIKIRGQRVELDEITEAIRQSGTAACATLFLKAAETGTKNQIISFVVFRWDESVKFQSANVDDKIKEEIQSLYRALESRLPAYMVPSAIIPISALPTTASGKLDRARLKAAFRDLENNQLALVSYGAEHNVDDGEWSAIEVEIAEAISSALNVSKADVQRWTPLATLGLDSISAIQVSRHLHTKLGVRFPISVILQNSSVARLAKVLPVTDVQNQGQKETPELLSKDVTDEVAGRLTRRGKVLTKIRPCTPLQEAMLATSSGAGQYLNRMLFKVNGSLETLKDTWNAMVARHDILRTCFVGTDNAQWPMLQVVLDQWQAPWHDFAVSSSCIENCISRHAQTVSNAVDSLEPAVSFATIRHDDSVYLSFVCHHALYDGVAIERLLYEVEQHASGSPLPPTPAYDQFLRESLRLPPSTDSFWLEYLANYEPKLTSHLTTKFTGSRADVLNHELDVPLSEVKMRIRELGVSLLALTQTAWATALGCIFHTGDMCFGNVVNGRSLAISGIEELVAPCFNTIPIRMDLARRQRNLDLMKAFQSLNAELMQYQFTPLRRIQSFFSQHGDRRLFDTLLLLQQSPRPLDQSLWTLERDDGEMDVRFPKSMDQPRVE
jgi:amino acid adenylation domain-containing protein